MNREQNMRERIKEVELSVLATFKEEIPSIYFSDKSEKEYQEWKAKAAYLYRDLLKFPTSMFQGRTLIDCGAGTGENTVYLANWGARCTLVDMNDESHRISKEVFQKYTNNYNEHRFFCSSLFDYETDEKYDIVHCRGVLSHTNDKEGLFSKIASFLKPGGYMIFGDPNKAGEFQNMLQRYIIYRFSRTWDEMIGVAERLFKEDIDRSQRFASRTRRAIIFDRWVVQKQNDPSVGEVLRWFDQNDLVFYSSWPPILFPVLSDSLNNKPKFQPQSFKDIGVFTEAIWLMHKDDDVIDVPKILKPLSEIADRLFSLVDYMSDCRMDSVIEGAVVKEKADNYLRALEKLDLTAYVAKRTNEFVQEVKEILDATEGGDIEKVHTCIKKAKHLFRGANGVRHVDYIAYKKSAGV
ncbi:MAG: hypothetical protein A3H70_03740 [Candidatus Komeilibacteria bacterium RIFCSPLOWO2_02_FULL_48_11]|uniref:Methyltransferase domain-containing protein n=1 Tax=Candidatus Komeilibacteria bacterium RIFCSPLOWO2_02_FULL_48_11 TaxID=1798553 RepID=A0A1G2BRH1_9BACT|nr:MAG: hypothetical protein A3H70_03740 [Candidatus Komeilibacteria bacterium RIFCSPLOWO2_02_FULL_48_11]